MKVKPELQDLVIHVESGFPGNYSKQTYSHIDARAIQYTNEGNLVLSKLLKFLHPQDTKENFMVSYFSTARQAYVYLATVPVEDSAFIPKCELETGQLQLKFRIISSTELPSQSPDDEGSDDEKTGRRTKERKIGYIIEKVARWRNLYNGIQNAKGNTIRMTLEEAAKQVDISKKSLDDYLLQLRFGRKFGFNFEEHKNDKVGLLRAYVKKFKKLHLKPGQTDGEEELKKLLEEKGTPQCKNNKCCVPPPGVLQAREFTLG